VKRTVALAGAVLLLVLGALVVGGTADDPLSTGRYVLAGLPLLVVVGVMVRLRWGGQRAGPLGWLVGLLVAVLAFGLTFDAFWVSQIKGLLLSVFVLAVLWPALLLYNLVNQAGGIGAITDALDGLIPDRGLLLVVTAWAFSGMLEGLAGFGLPIAIVAPILVGLDISPVMAVAAVAVGHAWAVTFGDMGVIFQTLVGIVDVDAARLAPMAAAMLGAACLACGLATAHLLRQDRHWPAVVVLALLMGSAQYGLAVSGLTPLAALGAGLVGIVGGVAVGQAPGLMRAGRPALNQSASAAGLDDPPVLTPPLLATLLSYGALTVLLAAITLIHPLNNALKAVVWKMSFPQVTTRDGFVTPAGTGQVLRPLVHPGTAILLIALASYVIYRATRLAQPGDFRRAAAATWRSAMPASIGVVAMVGLSTLMDHAGMTVKLAKAASDAVGTAFPVVSPLVGMLGAFATGSNNNSNVLFAPLQQSVALLLAISPRLLLAAQTTGGSLGSMIAPAKIIVGCSTLGLRGRDGEVLRVTLPYGIVIGLGVGLLALLLAAF
jgi:lactate permease